MMELRTTSNVLLASLLGLALMLTAACGTAARLPVSAGTGPNPVYMTSVREGAFYGWPYSYYGQHVDSRVKPPRPDLVAAAVSPDYALGPHTASLGLVHFARHAPPRPFRPAACSSGSMAPGTASRAAATR